MFFDNINMKTRFSFQKHVRIMKLIVNVVDISNFDHRELKSLIDFLSFCVKIVVFDRFFFISLYIVFRRHVFKYNIIFDMRDNLL